MKALKFVLLCAILVGCSKAPTSKFPFPVPPAEPVVDETSELAKNEEPKKTPPWAYLPEDERRMYEDTLFCDLATDVAAKFLTTNVPTKSEMATAWSDFVYMSDGNNYSGILHVLKVEPKAIVEILIQSLDGEVFETPHILMNYSSVRLILTKEDVTRDEIIRAADPENWFFLISHLADSENSTVSNF